MTLPFTKQQVNTTANTLNYIQTASKEDFLVFADWFINGSKIWISPAGYTETVLAAIEQRKITNE
jgi:hypothetical protein